MKNTFLSILCAFLVLTTQATEIKLSQVQENATPGINAGVAVSPAHIYYKVSPGESSVSTVTINNDTDRQNKFKISFNDFNMNGFGKSEFLAPGTGDHSLCKWVNVSPSFVDLKPGEKVELTVTIIVPLDDADAKKAAWAIMLIEQTEERKSLDDGVQSDKIAFGIIPTFAFGVFLYQNPPNVAVTSVDIIDFRLEQKELTNALEIDVHNIGDGISHCTVYVDLTNMKTGETQKLVVKRFTIVPGIKRAFHFGLPEGLEPGQYSAVSVLDFGSNEELQAAEIEFNL
jgi:hypothetical protein